MRTWFWTTATIAAFLACGGSGTTNDTSVPDGSGGGSTPPDAGNAGALTGGAGATSTGGTAQSGGAAATGGTGGVSTGGTSSGGAAGDAAAGGAAGASTADASACNAPRPEYEECTAAENESDCVAQGGEWGRIGLAPFDECLCFTGQDDCPCTSLGDCLGGCIAPSSSADDCVGLTEGVCSGMSITLGCHCFFDPMGIVRWICAD